MIYFGTDGIRKKNEFFTPDFLSLVANGVALLPSCRKVAIARDTRASGKYMEEILIENLVKRGVDVVSLGVIPSPCLAFCTRTLDCDYGIMLSASHNPPSYNGIKLFLADGSKARKVEEEIIESYVLRPFSLPEKNGKITRADGKKIYLESLCPSLPRLDGMKILLDCTHGAASGLSGEVFTYLGANVSLSNADFDGEKINVGCGAEHADLLIPRSSNFDACFSFDGDADRVKAIKSGKALDGDHIMYCAAKVMKQSGKLKNNAVCGTVMTNSGVEKAYSRNGIRLFRSDVGDREVFRTMQKNNLSLGGEKSGHIIFANILKTGDGILTAVFSSAIFRKYALNDIDDAKDFPSVSDELIVSEAERVSFSEKFGKGIFKDENGVRFVVRASGTEPKIRFLAESEDITLAKNALQSVKNEVAERIKK